MFLSLRDRRGERHRLEVVLALAVTALLAGCRTLVGISAHVYDIDGSLPDFLCK